MRVDASRHQLLGHLNKDVLLVVVVKDGLSFFQGFFEDLDGYDFEVILGECRIGTLAVAQCFTQFIELIEQLFSARRITTAVFSLFRTAILLEFVIGLL